MIVNTYKYTTIQVLELQFVRRDTNQQSAIENRQLVADLIGVKSKIDAFKTCHC